MKIGRTLVLACSALTMAFPAISQTYRNVSNRRFAPVSNGPMHALIVDVPNLQDPRGIAAAVQSRVAQARKERETSVARYIDAYRRALRIKGEMVLGAGDIVILRQNGRLSLPNIRTRAGGDITFTVPGPGETAGWPLALQADLNNMIQRLYAEMKAVYGDPSWTGTVKILNGDNITPIISDPNALSGGIYNVTTNEITLAQYRSVQSMILNLTQMMAIAFRGPAGISFDPWERGMARAATLQALRNAKSLLAGVPSGAFGGTLGDYDVSDPLWHVLDRYELLNQPALGNDRFFPVSKKDGEANTASFPGMLVPRLQMSGSAWLKVLTRDPSFLRTFNAAYYTAVTAQPNTKNDVAQLRMIAAAALQTDGVSDVEGLDFETWFQRQYVLDSSVSPGIKEYVSASPLRPNAGDDDFAVAAVVNYYQTAFDGSGNSNEVNLNSTSFPVYWDFDYTNRLFLAAQYERVEVRDGIGSVAPTFFDVIGGAPDQHGRMRITIDFPIGAETTRIYVAPRSMGTQADPNNFWGTVVGADSGKIKIQTDNGITAETDVKQGAFGAKIDVLAFSKPSRSTITFTPDVGNPTVRNVITGYNEYQAVFFVNETSATKTHTFLAGPQMVSFPIAPFAQKPSQALLDPVSGNPIFTDGNLLMAQWRQSIIGTDKYMKNPTMGPLLMGKGYWFVLPTDTTVKVVGRTATQDAVVTTNLLNGWNQIGSPYDATIPMNSLQFQYLADNVPVDLQTAITKGYIDAIEDPNNPTTKVVLWSFNPNQGYIPATSLEAWKGYWIKVRVSEGVSITYPSQTNGQVRRSAETRAATPSGSGWGVPITVRDQNGLASSVMFGQTPNATRGYDPKSDALLPPAFASGLPRAAFLHTDWGTNAGEYYSDIRSQSNRDAWTLYVETPNANQSYTLSWGDLSRVPRTTRLILLDKSTGQRQYLNSTSSYTFNSGTTGSRRFDILPEIRSGSVLRITNVVAKPTRADGRGTVEIAYQLTQTAQVTTEIRSASGQVIRRLSTGRSADMGVNRMVWDAKDERSISVPSGVYMVRINAQTPDGERANFVSTVTLVR